MANVYKRVRKNGSHSWYMRYRDNAGREIKEIIPQAQTKRQAELRLAERLREIQIGNFDLLSRQREIKFFEIVDDFLLYGRDHKRCPGRDVNSTAKQKKFFGNIPCQSITKPMIENYVAARQKGAGGLGKAAKPATINRELACLKTLFRRAWNDKKMADNPMQGFKLLPEDNVRNRVLTEEEFERLLNAAPEHIKPILLTAWETGMRRGEIIGLRRNQVDFRKGIITLFGQDTKTNKSHRVPMNDRLKECLERLPVRGENFFKFNGKPFKVIRGAFLKACRVADIVDFRFHDLRHCFVTRMRRKGVNDRVIMKITGHETLECFRRYDTISDDDLIRAVR